MPPLITTLSRGQLRNQINPMPGDAVILILEDESDLNPRWIKTFQWSLVVGFRDLEDAVPQSFMDRIGELIKRIRFGPDLGIPQNRIMPAQARRIADFAYALPNDDSVGRILVACEYGRSRSVSIARYIAEIRGWAYSSSFPGNTRVCRLLRETAQAKPKNLKRHART